MEPCPEISKVAPAHNQSPAAGGIPIPSNISMAARAQARTVMMAETALKRHQSCSVQFAKLLLEERAAAACILIRGELHLTAAEGRSEHAEGTVGRHLEHHAACITRLDGPRRFLHCPPARPATIVHTYTACACFRRRILLGQAFLALHVQPELWRKSDGTDSVHPRRMG